SRPFLRLPILLSMTADSTTFPLWSESFTLPFVRPSSQAKSAVVVGQFGLPKPAHIASLLEIIWDLSSERRASPVSGISASRRTPRMSLVHASLREFSKLFPVIGGEYSS